MGILCHPLQVPGSKSCKHTATEAETALQMLMNNWKKKEWNWENYVSQHVKYNVIVENLKMYQDIDPVSKCHYLLNGIGCDKLSMAAAAEKIHKINMRRTLMQLSPSHTIY